MTTLRTSRLVLRPPEPADIDAILAIHQDPRACAHNPSDKLATHTEAVELCGRWLDHWQRHGFGYWVVRGHDEPRVLGFCGLKVMTLQERPVLNLFYRFDADCWGAGFATEAASEVVRWASAHHSDTLLIARVRPANAASHRVAIRAGLVRTPQLDEPGYDGMDEIYATG
jgi:RimJ/RimL family protein N-acetyltransferase